MNAARNIVVVLLYLWVSVGITVATHFCAGEPVSTNLLDGTEQSTGCCCGDEAMNDCCDTSISSLRVGDAHLATAENLTAFFAIDFLVGPVERDLPSSPSQLPALTIHPPGDAVPTHILICSILV